MEGPCVFQSPTTEGPIENPPYDPEKQTALEAWGRRLEQIVSGTRQGAEVGATGAARGSRLPSKRYNGLRLGREIWGTKHVAEC